jgi:hypothetical protein
MNVFHPDTYMASYRPMLDFAKTRRARKLGHNTYLEVDDGETRHYGETPELHIHYHACRVVTLHHDRSITLRNDGWQTSTTKERINAFTPSGISVWQRSGNWYVTTEAGCFDWRDGMTVRRNGFCDTAIADPDEDARARRRELYREKKARDAYATNRRELRKKEAEADLESDVVRVLDRLVISMEA